jgi:hypothetical protein
VRILLKILLSSLVLVLILALGTEVVALHRNALPPPDPDTPPVVVRKSATAPEPPKTVRVVGPHPPAFFFLRKHYKTKQQHKAPAS